MTMEYRIQCLNAAREDLSSSGTPADDIVRLAAKYADFVVHGAVPDDEGEEPEPCLGEAARTLDEPTPEERFMVGEIGRKEYERLNALPHNTRAVAAEETTHRIGDISETKRTEFAAPGVDISAYAGSTNLPATFDAAHDLNARFMDEHHGD